MTTRRQAYLGAVLASSALLLVSACGDDSKPPAGAGGGTGSGNNDNNGGASGSNNADMDGAVDGSVDGGQASDGGSGGVETECEVLGDVLTFDSARANGRIFSAAMAGNTTHLVYLVPTCSGTATKNNAQGLKYVSFDTQGEASASADVVNNVDCYITRDPALVAGADGALDLFFTSNIPGSFELYAQDLKGGAAAVQQTTDTDNELGVTATSLVSNDPPMAAYVNDVPASGVMAAATVTKQIGKVESEVLASTEGHHATQIAIARVASSVTPALGAVGWISDREETSGAHLRLIDQIGKGKGDVIALGKPVGSSSAVAIATTSNGAGIAYTVAPNEAVHELRFRSLSKDGVIGKEVKVTSGNQNVRDISIASYAAGYVISYRQVGSGAPSMRLVFLDEDGNVAGTRQVAAASVGGAGSQVLVANDGRIVLVWNDLETVKMGDEDAGTATSEMFVRVRAARLECE